MVTAADGFPPAMREKLYPGEGPPIWNGRILWRGITKAKPFLTGRSMIMAGYQPVKFVAYPISRDALERGEPTINSIPERELAADSDWRREDYSRAGKREEFAPWVENWNFDWLDVPGLILAGVLYGTVPGYSHHWAHMGFLWGAVLIASRAIGRGGKDWRVRASAGGARRGRARTRA